MATLILGVGEKLEDFVTVVDHGGKDNKDFTIDLHEIDTIVQSKTRGETILQGPFTELSDEFYNKLIS
jgi:hypothetical protein